MDASSFVSVHSASLVAKSPRSFLDRVRGQAIKATPLLTDITFSLAQGDQIIVYGAEGAGKTVLLRMLAGFITPSSGHVSVNSELPTKNPKNGDGYVSIEELGLSNQTSRQIISHSAEPHSVKTKDRILAVAEQLQLSAILDQVTSALSTIQRLRINLARALISDSPLLLLDDVAEMLGIEQTKHLLKTAFLGRTALIVTRSANIAEQLDIPIILLHQGRLAQRGTREEIATSLGCPRIIDVWVEGVRYDLLRQLRKHVGVLEVRLLASSRFVGQRLRITIRSTRYLPAIYDTLTTAPLIQVVEIPPSLTEIVAKMKT